MAFKTDGSSHKNGIKNELMTIDVMNKYADEFSFKEYITGGKVIESIRHFGGTKTTADAIIKTKDGNEIGVTIKNHKKTGTWDYLNSSSNLDIFNDHVELKEKISEIRNKYLGNFRDMKHYEELKPNIKNSVDQLFLKAINNINSEKLIKLLLSKYNEDCDLLAMNMEELKKIVFINKEDRYDYKIINENIDKEINFIKGSKSFGSARVWLGDVETPFRVRITLNNGIRALVGMSTSNKNSVLAIKVQNDQIKKVMRLSSNTYEINLKK